MESDDWSRWDKANLHSVLAPRCCFVTFKGTSEEAPCQWRPRDDAHTKMFECGEHFAFLLSVHKRVVVLH